MTCQKKVAPLKISGHPLPVNNERSLNYTIYLKLYQTGIFLKKVNPPSPNKDFHMFPAPPRQCQMELQPYKSPVLIMYSPYDLRALKHTSRASQRTRLSAQLCLCAWPADSLQHGSENPVLKYIGQLANP